MNALPQADGGMTQGEPGPLATAVPDGEALHGVPFAATVHLGDCVQGMKALPDASVDLMIADPPYDIGVQKSGWDTVPHYLEWSRTWLAEAARVLRPAGQLFIYGSPAKLWIARLKILAADEFGFDFKQHISWCYKQGGDSRFASMAQYAVRMEHLEWLIKPAPPGVAHTFHACEAAEKYTAEETAEALAKGVGRVTEESLRQGRPPRNWVEIPRENSKSLERKYGAHPCMKPLKLCERLVLVHSNRSDLVLVPFGGSGSEVVAAAKLGRHAICFENDPSYHAIILRRLAGHSIPVLGADGVALLVPPSLAQSVVAPVALGPLETSNMFASGYKGVFKQGRKFIAKIRIGGTLLSLGAFDAPHDAAVAYRTRAIAEGHLPGAAAASAPASEASAFASAQPPLAAAASAQVEAQPLRRKRGRAHRRDAPLALAVSPLAPAQPLGSAAPSVMPAIGWGGQAIPLATPFVVGVPVAAHTLPCVRTGAQLLRPAEYGWAVLQ
ncbi:hypothetical protein KFE25_008850 [Diacronema lutheri]|uniref:DNA methylase N-4/N-6 domain-containing protein n=1 Tax=Diacronema lutheri TaxID=2081491 RepID=A0A8J5XTT6_DIALT|nr:hypothetical protein KFE25_008850 [Diacronema lutheri]